MQSADIRGQDSAYRRGLVLGLTMAEIMTLIIFALLLILTALTLDRDKRIKAQQQRIHELELALQAAAPQGLNRESVEDIFRELELARRSATALKDAREKISRLEEREKSYERIDALAKAAGIPDSAEGTKELASKLAIANLVEAALAREGKSSRDPGAALAVFQEAEQASRSIGILRGQVANLQAAAKAAGHGGDYPPCWADQTTGRPEFIFDVSITSAGIIVRDNALPQHSAEEAALPIQAVQFGQPLGGSGFIGETQALYDWSNHQDPACRFFVRLYDLTGDGEKALFKSGLRSVESHFYKLLLDRSPEAPQ